MTALEFKFCVLLNGQFVQKLLRVSAKYKLLDSFWQWAWFVLQSDESGVNDPRVAKQQLRISIRLFILKHWI